MHGVAAAFNDILADGGTMILYMAIVVAVGFCLFLRVAEWTGTRYENYDACAAWYYDGIGNT